MASLQTYVARQFPNHDIDLWEATSTEDLELSEHTVVSYVVGARDGLDLLNAFRRSVPDARVAAMDVRPSEVSVVPSGDEDTSGVVDLPVRRVAASVMIGAIGLAVMMGLLGVVVTDSWEAGIVLAFFGVLVGGAVGAIVGGGRLAGERATSQPVAPGKTIVVVAAFLDDDASAASLAKSVDHAADYQVRIVDHDGGWRTPGDAPEPPSAE